MTTIFDPIKLVEQVTVGAMDFHTVETSSLGILGTDTVGVDNVGDFSGFQCARRRVVGQGADQAHVALGLDRAGRHRGFAIQVRRMGDPAHVPQLQEDLAAGAVDRLGDVGPCLLYTSPSPRDATLSRMPSSA